MYPPHPHPPCRRAARRRVVVSGSRGGGGDGGGGGCWVMWLQLGVVVVDRCDAVRLHLSELEISLNSDRNFKSFPVSSTNYLKSRIY